LLEVLVAFVVLSASLGVVMNILSASMSNTDFAQRNQHALVLAESRMAALVAEPELEVGTLEGEFEAPYRWEALVEEWEFPEQQTASKYTLMPYLVRVAVIWGEHDSQQVVLTTVYLGNEDAL